MLVYSVMAMAIGNSLFVNHVGADHLPFAYIFIGLCSMPAYVLFSQVVDRFSRPKLFRYVLLGSVFIALGLWLLLQESDSAYVYYILLVAVFFQWDFHNNVLYPSLLTDYFTTLEYKRYASNIGIAQAIGTLAGGGLTILLSQHLTTPDLLLCLPIVFALGIGQLLYLESSQRQLTSTKPETHVGIVNSLQAFPDLVKRYPLVALLAASSFLLVIIYISSEFLWFSIYGDYFSDQALTSFLGLMRIVISLVQIGVIYGVTRPLLRTLGVAQMNPVYPLTTLVSFFGLMANFGLPAAIGLHLNGDGLYKGINLPVHQLNYNAIPREFIGRIRALSDGFIYSIGLTLAGVLLWVCETHLALMQVAWLTSGLTGILLLVRLPMGRYYASGLEEMIRSNSVNLDDFDTYDIPLSPQSSDAVRELLVEPDRYTQLKGLELAARMNQPAVFLSEIEALTVDADTQVYGSAIAVFARCSDLVGYFQQQLDDPARQAFALEVLLINQYRPTPEQVSAWIESPRVDMRVLGAIAQRISDPTAAPPWPTELDGGTARIITRVVAYSQDLALRHLIPQVILTQSGPEVIKAGLEALLPLTERGDQATATMAQEKLDHPDAIVRMAAFELLKTTRCGEQLAVIGEHLGDPDPRVRQKVANTLAAYGRSGLEIAKASLRAAQPEVVSTAITAIGLVRTKYASNLLFDYLAPSYRQLGRTRKWQQQIPQADPQWQPLRVAIADYHDRLIQKVLYVLSALGHARTVNTVNRLLTVSDQSELENALEVLASLNHRRFVLPLMPLFEEWGTPPNNKGAVQATPQWLRAKGYRLLLEALESKDRWIKIGALIALSAIPSAFVNDPDPLVKQVTSQIFGTTPQQTLPGNTTMNRLLLLKNVALFKNLSLDELMLIDKSLEQTQVLAGETIFTEGDWGTHLYIIAEGSVQLLKEIDGTPRKTQQLHQGHYFGEVALFDDAPRWDGAVAAADCTLLKLGKSRFLSLITQRPHIILEICRFLSQRLRETDKHYSADKAIALGDQAEEPLQAEILSA